MHKINVGLCHWDGEVRSRMNIYDDEMTHLKALHFDVRPRPDSNQNHSDTNGRKRLCVSITSKQAMRYNEVDTHV